MSTPFDDVPSGPAPETPGPFRSTVRSLTPALALSDPQDVQDLERLLVRARNVADTGVRLRAEAGVLAVWVSVLAPRGLGDRVPVALGLRTLRLAGQESSPDTSRQGHDDAAGSQHHLRPVSSLDEVYSIGSILERLSRMRSTGGTDLALPPVTEAVTWTAVTPPQSGWQPVAIVEDAELQQVAQAGVRELAEALPQDPGASMVAQARAAVWGRMLGGPDPTEGILPAAAAFAAHSLGFLSPQGTSTVHANGPWIRLSSPVGHVLCRTAPRL